MNTILISGQSGFIGTHLTKFFQDKGYTVNGIPRDFYVQGNENKLINLIEQSDIIINLAGAPINKRWSKKYKEILYNSRIETTKSIINAIKKSSKHPELLISTSAVGIYPSSSDSDITTYDTSYNGETPGFLAKLCRDWENEAKKCPDDVRLVITRFGIVLSEDGGALKTIIDKQKHTPFSIVIGSGKQPFPYINLQDLCNRMYMIINQKNIKGVQNFVSDELITQKELALKLKKEYHKLMLLHIPKVFFKILYGDGASFIVGGQRVRR